MLCQKVVLRPGDVNAQGRMIANTYCMRPGGHPGKCAPQKRPEDAK